MRQTNTRGGAVYERLHEVEKQRDDLLAALHIAETALAPYGKGGDGRNSLDYLSGACDAVRAAIANATKE